jgi:ADP-ribose pyrophosphatase YjhB (NUDIX family)
LTGEETPAADPGRGPAGVRTAARAVIRRGDALLVVRSRDALGEWFVLPGGGQRRGESLAATLAREVAEETGWRVRVGPLRFVRECVAGANPRRLPPGFHQVEALFACELDGPADPAAAAPEPDPGQLSVEWRTLAELRALPFFPRRLLDVLDDPAADQYLGVD